MQFHVIFVPLSAQIAPFPDMYCSRGLGAVVLSGSPFTDHLFQSPKGCAPSMCAIYSKQYAAMPAAKTNEVTLLKKDYWGT